MHECKKDLQLHHIACLELAVLTRGHVEGNSLAFIERLEAVHLDLGKMNEKVFAILLGDEAIAFFRVEPLNSTFRHFKILFSSP